jgi:Zn-finger protein
MGGCSFFSNTACEYYPCHKIEGGEDFNCLFCFCPLYGYDDCGGKPARLSDGRKDCSGCIFPHKRESYALIIERLRTGGGN